MSQLLLRMYVHSCICIHMHTCEQEDHEVPGVTFFQKIHNCVFPPTGTRIAKFQLADREISNRTGARSQTCLGT
jgi:hypothetical protein